MTRAGGTPGGVEVCFADLTGVGSGVEAGMAMLSSDELARASRLHFAPDRQRYIGSHLALRSAVSERTGISPTAIELWAGVHGKPEVRGVHGFQFSMSRAGDLAAFAFASMPVGIDVVAMASGQRLREAVAEFCSPAELARISSLPAARQVDVLAQVWARKEALLKATGHGLYRQPSGVTVWQDDVRLPDRWTARLESETWVVRDVAAPEGYCAAVAYRLS